MPSIELPEVPSAHVDELTHNDVHRICCWLQAHATAAIAQSGCATEEQISIEPRPNKQRHESPLNDYTADNTGTESDLGAISIDASVGAEHFITHGVLIESNSPQNFGSLEHDETIIVRSGTLRYWVDENGSSEVNGDSTLNVIYLNARQTLKVQAIDGPVDYTCFYGSTGRAHVLYLLNYLRK